MSAKKKVVFCTYSSIYSSIVLEQLIANDDIDLVAIINSTRVLKPSLNSFQGALHQLKMSGLSYSSYLFFITNFFNWIQALLKLIGRQSRNIHTLSKEIEVPILDTRDINSAKATDYLQQLKPDYLLCAHFNQLLKSPVLSIKNLECINIHPSLLPNYKGVDPVFFAMRDNIEEVGVSVHRMNNDFDSGEVLLQNSMILNKEKSLLSNNCLLFDDGAKLAINWMTEITTNKALPLQNKTNKNYDSWPSRLDVKKFKMSGNKLMNLSELWKLL